MIWLLVTVIVVCGRGEYCVCLVVKSSNFLLMTSIVLKPKSNKYNRTNYVAYHPIKIKEIV